MSAFEASEIVSAGGIDSAATITSAREDVYGQAKGAIIGHNGLQQIFAGGAASGCQRWGRLGKR